MVRYHAMGAVLFGIVVAATVSGATPAWAQSVIITEFMASNEVTLPDDDGAYTDWIELYCAGPDPADLDGWFLTDDPGELTLWRLPGIVLEPGEFLVVFASGNDRRDPAGELHTNFRLEAAGDYLALVEPDGITVSQEFIPSYPLQFEDISYGIAQDFSISVLVGEAATARAFVPTDGTLGAGWTELGFADGTWTQGTTGVGFDTGSDYDALIGLDLEAAMRDVNATAYVRVPFQASAPQQLDQLVLDMKYDDGFVAFLNGQEVARRNAPASPSWDSTATAEHGQPELGSLAQTFSGGGTAYELGTYGEPAAPEVVAGGPTGQFLRLVPDDTGSVQNTVGFDRVFGPAQSIDASFDFRMPEEASHTGCCAERADGFGFALVDTAVYGDSGPGPVADNIVWERPVFPDAFSVGFDVFDGTGNENTVSLNFNGVQVASRLVTEFLFTNGRFNRCEVQIRQDGAASIVTVTLVEDSLGTPEAPLVVFDGVRVNGMTAFSNRVAFGGRTGGAFISLDLDNIDVAYSSAASPEISWESIDISEHIDLLAQGDNVLAIHGLNAAVGDADFLALAELVAVEHGGLQAGITRYYPEPTPGGPNSDGVAGFAEIPTISHPGGGFGSTFDLEIAVSSPDAVIRYTTNRSEPTESSPEYTAPLSISVTSVVKVKVFEEDLLPSPTITRTFVRLATSVRTFDSNLPIVLLDTFGQGIGQGGQTPLQAVFVETDAVTGRATITDAPSFQGNCGIKIRGSSSTGFPKKQYAFEVWDELGNDRDVSLLGKPAESDWVLYAPYSDKSLMRNVLSYKWARDLGVYSVRTEFCEVYLNTGTGSMSTSDYQGVYVLVEKIKRNQNRVDIENLLPTQNSEPEISGGYIFKKDRIDPGDAGFSTPRISSLAYVDPKEREITSAQANWLGGYLNAFEAALYGADFTDPVLGYRPYIDIDSWVENHMVVELTKNIDGYRLSSFYFKDRSEKLKMGPVWDYNLSIGNANYLNGWIPSGWYYELISANQYPWFPRLFQDPDFEQRYVDRWAELRRDVFRTERLVSDIDERALLLGEAQQRNFDKWPTLGTYVWPNWFIADTYEEEIDWTKGWLEQRLAWMDSVWLTAPAFSQDGGLITPGFELRMSAPAGTVYYTLDGSDPRLDGGDVAPAAQEYGSAPGTTLVSAAVSPEVRALVPANGGLGLSWTDPDFNDASWASATTGIGVGYERSSGYETYIDLDAQAAMDGIHPSIYIRIPFDVDDVSAIETLTLEMRYDDGFVAYVNGTVVASAGAPVDPQWDSSATGLHDDAQAVIFQGFDASAGIGALRNGSNVLAIHGLNESVGSSDFLIEPQLRASATFEGEAIVLDGPTQVIARTFSGGRWSAPTDETFVLESDLPLRITELMYHPQDLPETSPYAAKDLEFIEIANLGVVPVDLTGVKLTGGVTFDFTGSPVETLGAGEIVLVVKSLEAFEWFYDTSGMAIAGEFTGSLSNGGEQLGLEDGTGEGILLFDYDDAWFPQTDGGGYSLVIRDPFAPRESWSDPASWAPGGVIDGTPGTPEDDPPPPSGFQLAGDSNQDANVDIADAVSLLRRLFGGGVVTLPCEGELDSPGNLAVLDSNGDDGVDVSDVVYVLGWLFTSGPAPAGGTECRRVQGCANVCQ